MSPVLTATALESSGAQRQAPVLLVHGFASTPHHNWVATGWVSALQAAGHPVHLVTLPFHELDRAENRPSAPAYRVELDWGQDAAAQLTAALTGYVEGLGQAVHPVGFSLGARLIWQLAVEQPQLVRSLIAGGMPAASSLHRVQAALHMGAPLPAGFEAVLASTPVSRQNLLDFTSASFAGFDTGALPTCPVFMFAGSRDTVAAGAQEVYRRLPAGSGTWLEVPRRDHISVLTSGLVRRTAVKFLGGQAS